MNIPVLIKGDSLDEPDETLFVDLASPEHATIARSRGVVTIVDDDPAPVRILDAAVEASWSVHRSYTRVRRLLVTRAPLGASLEVHCAGQGCPFKRHSTAAKVTAFGAAKLRPGTRVQLWIDAPGMIGRVFQYTIRTARAPRIRTLCLSPAATKPGPC